MKIEDEKLKSFLLDLDLITDDEFQEASKKAFESGQKIENILIEEGFVTEEKIGAVKAHILGLPFIDLERLRVSMDVLKKIPENFARTNNVVPIEQRGDVLEVAMVDPDDLKVIETIKKASGLEVLPRLATKNGIKNVLRQYQESLETEINEMVTDTEDQLEIKNDQKEKEDEDLEKAAKEIPVIKVVDVLIKHAILERASDIHIEPQEEKIIVRYRIDGVLRDAMVLPIDIASGVVARIKVLSNLKLDEHRLPQDGRFKVESKDFKYSLRVSVLPVSEGEKIVMRLLSENEEVMDLEEIGLQRESLSKVRESIKRKSGMILVTGPTGSGKTTTLYSLLKNLNTIDVNIFTIEDPIEYRIPRINQTQINPKIGFTFASGLRSLVRQDPDILMVGEIRDSETAHLSINAALTGHLVLSTLHTTNAAGAISRLIDMGIEPFLVSSTLNIVIAQRLLRKLHGRKEGYYLTDKDFDNLSNYCDVERINQLLRKYEIIGGDKSLRDVQFYKPKPSQETANGYKGRVGVYEVLMITDRIKELISEKKSSVEIEKELKGTDMITMFEDGIIKAAQGVTSIDEVLRILIE